MPVTQDAASASQVRQPAMIGLVGLGLVGTALGQRMRQAGLAVLGFDQRSEARDLWARRGGRLAESVLDLGCRCERVVLAVYDSAGVLQVVEGEVGLLMHTTSPSITHTIIDCSTGDPEALQALAERLAARGINFIEAPLSGSSEQIAAGRATMLLGGEPRSIEKNTTLLDAIAPRRIHVGGAGMGARAKLATNLVLGLNRAALAEGFVFAQALGIPAETFLQLVLATPARSDAALAKGERMVSGDFTPQSRIRQHLKDLVLMLAAAQAQGQRLPLTESHAQLLRAAVAAGDGDLDNAAILRQLRREKP